MRTLKTQNGPCEPRAVIVAHIMESNQRNPERILWWLASDTQHALAYATLTEMETTDDEANPTFDECNDAINHLRDIDTLAGYLFIRA